MKLLLFSLLCLVSYTLNAAGIERIENAEGTIEFSNVPAKKAKSPRQTVIYKYPQSGDITIFTDQKPTHVANYQVLKFDCYACNPNSKIDWHTVYLNVTAFSDSIQQAAQKHSIDPALIRAIIHAESAFNPKATSNKGAQGLMQLMPATAEELGVNDALNPNDNIQGGTRYIAQLLKQFNGIIKLASAAYNAGPNAVKRYQGVPPYEETEVYVERVGILHKRYKQAS
jgi:soluble lytic murein transglycosylase-like protein